MAKEVWISNYSIVFFDGVCNFCNGTINVLIDRDKRRRFRYASLQSDIGMEMCRKHDYSTEHFESIILQEGDRIYDRSTAVLRIAKGLGGFYCLLYGLIVIPKFFRDTVYMFLSRNRYKWFGKKDNCRLPTPEERSLFLS